jgi:hypothetical protein
MQLLLKRILYIAILPFLLFACASTPTDSSVKTEDFSKKTAVTYDRQREQTAFVELETGIEQTNQENRPQLISQNNTVIPVEKYQPYVKIKEIGYGATVNEARRDALENLVSSIQINVLKLVKLCTNDFGDCGSVVKVNTQSELPIMGAHYQRLNSAQNNEKFLVWIDSKSSLPIYVRDLDRLSSQITKALGILETLKPASQRYRVIDELLGLILQYDKKQIVANALGAYTKEESFNVSVSKLKEELKQLEKKASSLGFAAKVLIKNISAESIFVQAAHVKNTKEVTPFAYAIKEYVSAYLDTVSVKHAGKYTMQGEYEILENGDIFLSYQLIDLNYKVINRNSIVIAKAAHHSFRSKPDALEFETVFHSNVSLNNEFRAELKTQDGTDSLYYKIGERIKLFVRLNKPGYYYIIGHITQTDDALSYLLELNEGDGNEKFIRYISPEQANHYVEIASFDVIPPHGVEHLQLMASAQKIKKLPNYRYDKGYYVIDGSKGRVVQTVRLVRGLGLHKEKNALISESMLTYTTAR